MTLHPMYEVQEVYDWLVVLYAMLFGTIPFKANSMDELHQLIISGQFKLPTDVS